MSRIKRISILAVLGHGDVRLDEFDLYGERSRAGDYHPVRSAYRRSRDDAGLKFKVPFIQDVNLIDKRILEWDGNPSDMPTKDKLYISVDLFARWRIVDPLQYFLAAAR